MPFTFKNVIDLAVARCGGDNDSEALSVIKTGINSGYIVLASTVAKKTATKDYTITLNQKKFILPDDLLEIVEVSHSVRKELFPIEYQKIGDLLFLNTNDIKSGTLTLTYVKLPGELLNDNDNISLADSYKYVLASYAAYSYFLSKKKYNAAQLLTGEFNNYINVGNVNANFDETDSMEDYTVKNTNKRGK